MLVERAGLSVDYREADGLSYRTRGDFEADRDRRDEDPLRWIERIEIAGLHADVLKAFLAGAPRFRRLKSSGLQVRRRLLRAHTATEPTAHNGDREAHE